MKTSISSIFSIGARLIATAALAALAGCASTMATRVTSFQQWPGTVQGQTYRLVASNPGQSNNLEYESYQDLVRANMGVTGLTEAPAGKPARFYVSFDYAVGQTQVMSRQPYDPFFYGPYGGFGPYWRYGGFGYMGPGWIDVPAIAYENSLSLRITDISQGAKEVYRSTANTLTARPDLAGSMPYLARAIFDNFPGNNGVQRTIKYPVGK